MLLSQSTAVQAHPKYRADIDGLRAVAILLVVSYHAFPDVVAGGFIGVDIFFVISGYLITAIIHANLARGNFSFSDFYVRRVRRIFPSLVLVMCASYIFGWYALLSDEYKQLGKHIAAGAGFISNFVLWSEVNYFDNAAETKPLLHLWSLGIEEQFYLLWPLLLWLACRAKINLLLLTVTLATVSLAWNVLIYRDAPDAAFFLPHTRFWELLIGGFLAQLTAHHQGSSIVDISAIDGRVGRNNRLTSVQKFCVSNANLLALTGMLLIALGLGGISKKSLYPGWYALIPTLGAACLIAAGTRAWINRRFLSNRYMVWVGLISYPLYLWHWPLLSFFRINEEKVPRLDARIAMVLVAIFLSWLTYRFVEKPVRSGTFTSLKAILLVAVMSIAGGAGLDVYWREGIETRPGIQGLMANRNELVRTPNRDMACLAYLNKPAVPFEYCRFLGEKNSETVAIIGDSHAHVAFQGLAEILSARGKNALLMANSGCPPFLGAEYGDTEALKRECRAKITAILEEVATRKSISKVFIFSRGAIYLTGDGFGEAERDYRRRPPVIAEPVFLETLQATVDYLVSSGKTVYVVAENPEIGVSPKAFVGRPLRQAYEFSLKREEVLQRQRPYLEVLKNLRNATVIQTLNQFCPADQCILFDNGKLLYADDDHISVAGSRFQARTLLAPYL